MATHSSILAWRIPWTEEPGGLQSMGSQESGMTEMTVAAVAALSLPQLPLSVKSIYKEPIFHDSRGLHEMFH